MNRIYYLVVFVFLISGCGEAQFYKHVQYENKAIHTESMSKDTIEKTASSLGYSPCSEGGGYCKDEIYYFSIKQVSKQGFELVFFHSFGGYPGPENKNVNEFSAALASNCSDCTIKIKESSSWGFRDEESSWVQLHP